MKIKFLKAGTGDNIIIHHNNQNIVVDGGNESKYLINEIDKIYKRKEIIDILIITHHDDDHIQGVIDLIKYIIENDFNKEKKFIKKVIFNSPRIILKKINNSESKLLSYKQAFEVEELLLQLGTDWKQYDETSELIEFDNLGLKILSPTKEDLNIYSVQKGAYLSSDNRCDWKSPMSVLEKHIDDKSQDISIPNKSSIVLNIICDDNRILLTGDITPDRFEKIIEKMYNDNGSQPVKFDIIKLPHHGSYRSLNKKILEKIECDTYIISTNSKKHNLPNKRTLMKVLKYLDRSKNRKIKFMFNYEEALAKLEISEKELKEYNFVIESNNKSYGISIG